MNIDLRKIIDLTGYPISGYVEIKPICRTQLSTN